MRVRIRNQLPVEPGYTSTLNRTRELFEDATPIRVLAASTALALI